ncbi:hypothetical protein ACFQZW_01915 [Lutibacter aestuarii]|uniref:Intradiol ring-cleavage dioxygenases domain-containing protein n=1 Tax=Lutibacter aestuarii TaxID=861111 RepID=A0ABW2Z353_9FLAO|nr:hypothetical protein [uncultured Lutibacter sp.]
MEYSSRRKFLQKTVLASTSIALLSNIQLANAFSFSNCPFEGYNSYAEEKNDLRNPFLSGKQISIKGQIFDKTGTNLLPNVCIEVWHLSPNSKSYKHRAKLKTDTKGNYHFITDFPNKEYGKSSRIYFKISNSETYYFTELVINSTGAHITDKHWYDNQLLDEHLFPITEEFENSSTITFNITL